MTAKARPRTRTLSNGEVRIDWFVYVDDKKRTAKGRKATQCKTEAEAERVAAEWNKRVDDEQAPRFSGSKEFDAVAQRWWEVRSGSWRETSQRARAQTLKRLTKRLGKRDIRELNEDAVELFAQSLCPPHTDYERSTVAGTMDLLGTIMNFAVGRAIEEHPCNERGKTIRAIGRRVAKAKCAPPDDRDAWTYAEAAILLEHCLVTQQRRRCRNPHWLQDAARFAMRTGCRLGELAALQWSAVDLERNLVRFRESRSYRETTATKNSQARTRPLSDDILACMHEMHARRTDDGYVFKNSLGNQINADALSSSWPKIRRRCTTVPQLEWHCWRHTWASMALDKGWTPGQAAYYIGDTEKVFREHYAHIIRDTHLDLNFFDVRAAPVPDSQPQKAARQGKLTRVK